MSRLLMPRGWPPWGAGALLSGAGAVAPPLGPAGAVTPFVPSNRFRPGGCNMPLSRISEAYEVLVIGIANPFALNWVPPNMIIGGTPAGEVFPLGRTIPLPNLSSVIHPGNGGATTIDNSHWHHISIGVDGEFIFPFDAQPDNVDRIAQSNGNRSTLLKARVTLAMGNSRTRFFDIDIGAGVEIDVKCRAVAAVEALVPDPTSIPTIVPEGFEAPPGGSQFAVAVTTTVTTCSAPKVHRACAKYSQAFFIDPTATPTQANGLMPIFPDAQEIQLFASDVIAAAGSVTGQFFYLLDQLVPSYITMAPPPPPAAPMGDIVSAAGQANTIVDMIPGNANAIVVSRGAATDNTTINVVQILNV